MVLPSVADMVVLAACVVATGAAAGDRTLHAGLSLPGRASADAAEKTAFATLHAAARAASPLRAGLTEETARKVARRLRPLLGAEAVALVGVLPPDGGDTEGAGPGEDGRPADGEAANADQDGQGGDGPGGARDDDAAGSVREVPRLLAWDGAGHASHAAHAVAHAAPVLTSGRPTVVAPDAVGCDDPRCRVGAATVAPLTVERHVVGALAAYWRLPSAARVRAVGDAARLLTGQLELAGLDTLRLRLAEAELKALRAQISPHFVYNSLTTIASFVRTDPERARELLLDFADFARYSFRNPRDFTTLADELRSVDRYLGLERARFGDRLQCRVEVAPEVLPVALPFLALQPLVENAVRHGMAGTDRACHISITARDSGAEAAISIEDDGVGMDPERLQEILSAPVGRPGPTGWGSVPPRACHDGAGPGIGLANVDERMRQFYGDEYGLTVETALGAGTKVNLRVPKFRPGVFSD
ncbi:MAG TPA: histidine kinase [Spirillospora sp.]